MRPPETERRENVLRRFLVGGLFRWIKGGADAAKSLFLRMVRGIIGALERLRGMLSSTVFRWKHSLIMSFPLPAELKWHDILDCMAILTHGYFEETEKTFGESIATRLLCKTMFATGKKWIRSHSKAQVKSRPGREYYANMLTSAFKMLDITSRVEAAKNTIVVTNTACPYLDWGKKQGIQSERICLAFCGDSESFFSGVSYSLPYYVRYRSTHMMGLGDAECKKEFNGVSQHKLRIFPGDMPPAASENVLRHIAGDLSPSDGI